MTQEVWQNVDQWFAGRLGPSDPYVHALELSRAAGMPSIAVSPLHARMLNLLVKATGARRVLEVGTLGGYSACWMASALPADGELVSLEIDAKHADVARRALSRAGLEKRVDVRVGAALDLLPKLSGPFDFTFIDADKENNAGYFDHAVKLSRAGALIVVDNVVRGGRVLDANGDAMVQGVRRLADAIAADARVGATAIQTVGDKGYDGFLLARVR